MSVGALLGLALMALNVPGIVGVGIGVIAIMAGYQAFNLKLVPVLSCLVLVNVCLNPEIQALYYSMGRLWDTAIGLTVGMLVNTLIFPYGNSRKKRQIMESLDRDLFDGDEHLPQAENLAKKLDILEGQLVLLPSDDYYGASVRNRN